MTLTQTDSPAALARWAARPAGLRIISPTMFVSSMYCTVRKYPLASVADQQSPGTLRSKAPS
jgi:hypothetical protein